jgi:hypothetical protein
MKAPHKVGKEGTKKEDRSMNQKNKTQSGSQKVTKTNYVSKSPPVARNIYERKRDGKPKKKVSLKEPSLATIGCFKTHTKLSISFAYKKHAK